MDDIHKTMTPILRDLSEEEDSRWFVFSTISQRLEKKQYTTPYQFCEDVRLVLENACKCTDKTHQVYKAALRVS